MLGAHVINPDVTGERIVPIVQHMRRGRWELQPQGWLQPGQRNMRCMN